MAVFRVERNTGYTVMSNHHLRKQGIVLKGKGLVVANAFAARRLGLYPCGLIPYQPGEDRRNPRSGKGTRKSRIYRAQPGSATKRDACGAQITSYTSSRSRGEPEAATSGGQPPILDLPTLENPTLDNPTLEKPTQEKPTLENPTQLNKDILSKEQSITDLSSTDSILSIP